MPLSIVLASGVSAREGGVRIGVLGMRRAGVGPIRPRAALPRMRTARELPASGLSRRGAAIVSDLRVTWLRPEHLERVRQEARLAQSQTQARNARDQYGYEGTPEESLANNEGALAAELAVSLYTGLPWNTDPELQLSRRVADVGDDIEVKNRRQRYAEYLLVNPRSYVPEHRYVITYGRFPELYLAGWLPGSEVATYPNKPLGAREGGYVAPASALRDIRELEEPRGRMLECGGCGEAVEVFELPGPWIDPARFRCIPCLDDRHARREPQLELVPQERVTRKAETPAYDPAQARIPY